MNTKAAMKYGDAKDDTIKVLFIIASGQNNVVLYYCTGIRELFRLRKVFKIPDYAKLYRYIESVPSSDAYFMWNSDQLWWQSSDKVSGVGFGLTSFAELEPAFLRIGGKL